jgi:hypothetical protein
MKGIDGKYLYSPNVCTMRALNAGKEKHVIYGFCPESNVSNDTYLTFK